MQRQPREAGQALLAATFALVVLLGASGLAIDMGYLRYQKRLQQSAADSAALAGAAEFPSGNNAQIMTAATNDTALNGFTDGFTGPDGIYHVQITVNPAFAFGAATGVQTQVQVTQPTFFMRIFGVNSTSVTATAVAIPANSNNCIYALAGGAGITNSGRLTATGCGIADDENLANSGTINASSPATIAVHTTVSGGGGIIPAPVTGTAQAGDPFFRLTPPAPGGCVNEAISNGNPSPPPAMVTLRQGTYCYITVTGNRNVHFNPGTYIITQTSGVSGLSFNGTGSISGTGVTFYLASGAGPIAINNLPGSNQTLTLRAPTAGPYPGILFYQDPGNRRTANLKGTGGSSLQGALYFPSATLNLSDTGSAPFTIAVAKSFILSGTVNFGSIYPTPPGSPIKNAVLVE
jgi:Putative Flp pilus-assembly TadE/G-like